MIFRPKNRRYYVIDFEWQGRRVQKRTHETNAREASAIEAAIRSELERGNYGIVRPKPTATLAEHLKREFLPFVESQFKKVKPKTFAYYRFGVKMLSESDLAGLRLHEISDQHAAQFAASHARLQPTTINCALRTLRRALNLAAEWGKINRAPTIRLARGEHRRDRVLSQEEAANYLNACAQPWKDVAAIMLGTGMRPGEVYRLRWEHVLLNGAGGLIQVAEGKSNAARRLLPMVPVVYAALKARHEAQSCPRNGWVFSTASASGHLEETSAKSQHAKALAESKLKPFPPYTLRHTALTWMAPHCDAFTLARIAGHSSITMTARYVNPQTDAIERTFLAYAGRQPVPTILPTNSRGLPVGSLVPAANDSSKRGLVSREGIEPPTY